MTKQGSDVNDRKVLLVIDDEKEVTRSLRRLFRKQYEVHCATSAEEAMEILDHQMVHVVISDQRMPGRKGTEFFEELKKSHPNTVRMILTGYSDLDAVVDAINKGRVYQYVTKPWEPEELSAIVHDAFERYQLKAENAQLLEDLKQSNEKLERRVIKKTAALTESNRRLEASEAKYRLIFDHSPLGIFHFNDKGVLTACNRQMAENIAVPSELMVGFSLSNHLKDPQMIKALDSCLSGNAGVFEGAYTPPGKEESLFLKVHFNAVLDPGGAISGGIGILEDITEKKALQESQIQMQKLESLGILAGGIAHDFNNLLSIILGNISVAQDEASGNSLVMRVLGEAEKGALKASQLTRQFITFSSGGSPVRERTDLRKIINAAVEMALVGSNCFVQMHLPVRELPVLADSRQMTQVFLNVLENAAEAMPDGGNIEITAFMDSKNEKNIDPHDAQTDQFIHVRISDEGCGIDEKDLHRVMEPYFSTKDRGVKKGTGLGLSTAYAIMKKHDGTIQIESERRSGTRVTITLPLVAA